MKILIFLADGFEEVEALTVVDYLRRVDISVDMVSITESNRVSGAHYIEVVTNKHVSEVDISQYDGVVVPGGMPGATNLEDCFQVVEIIKEMHKRDKLVAAICAGPIVLAKANIIKDKNITSYPGFENQLIGGNYKTDTVVRDDNIITARGPYWATDFALEIVRYLLGNDKASQLKKDLLYK